MPSSKTAKRAKTKVSAAPLFARKSKVKRTGKADPQTELERLLRVSGTVLVRQNKHLIYRTPNGQNVVLPKTGSDHRGALNGVSQLRRALDQVPETPETLHAEPIPEMAPALPETEPTIQETSEMAAVSTALYQGQAIALKEPTAAPCVPVAAVPETCITLRERLDAAIQAEEKHQLTLMAEAEAVDRRLKMLSNLKEYADDSAVADILRSLLPAPPASPTLPAPVPVQIVRPKAPEAITECVQVTRDLVYAAIQTFDGEFKINDVMNLMVNGRQVDGPERVRIRNSIAGALLALIERGHVTKTMQGIGRKESIWAKVGPGNRVHMAPPPPALEESVV